MNNAKVVVKNRGGKNLGHITEVDVYLHKV